MRNGSRNNFLKASVLVIALIVIVNIPILREIPPVRFTKSFISFITYPFQFAAYKIVSGAKYSLGSVAALRGAQKENERLRERLSQEKAVNSLLESVIGENRQMRGLLNFKRKDPFVMSLLAAEVVSRSASSWFEVVTADKGTADGVHAEKAVINESGLVGRVIEADKYSSRIMLITDPGCGISVAIKRTGNIGSASGLGEGKMRIRYIDSAADVRVNDEVVTSGNSSVFPKGLIVGRVSSTGKKDYDLFQQVMIDTAVDFSNLEKIFILR
ncbi:MAG: rod shape-determining protein MreC [Candidatus Saganbacteria bacterium]|nr:rod shape-determining protein MreC [Candidatus Saganbacteria bacterium]